MPKNRILILHSFKDRGYEARLARIASNPDFDGISFSHCCVIDRDRSSMRIKELDRLADQRPQDKDCVEQQTKLLAEVVKQEIGPLLHTEISTFNPDIVIIHGGTVFNTVPGPCLTMIIGLMEQHPGVPFALEGKHEWLIRRTGMTYSTFERREAVNQIRWVKRNFVDDEDVEKVMKSVFEGD